MIKLINKLLNLVATVFLTIGIYGASKSISTFSCSRAVEFISYIDIAFISIALWKIFFFNVKDPYDN